METLRNVNLPPGNAVARLAKVLLGGGAFIYAATHSLFNVEGGHRAIVFNRILGIKEKVSRRGIVCPLWSCMPITLLTYPTQQ